MENQLGKLLESCIFCLPSPTELEKPYLNKYVVLLSVVVISSIQALPQNIVLSLHIHVIIPSSTHPFFTLWPLSTRNLNLVGILWAYMWIKYKEII